MVIGLREDWNYHDMKRYVKPATNLNGWSESSHPSHFTSKIGFIANPSAGVDTHEPPEGGTLMYLASSANPIDESPWNQLEMRRLYNFPPSRTPPLTTTVSRSIGEFVKESNFTFSQSLFSNTLSVHLYFKRVLLIAVQLVQSAVSVIFSDGLNFSRQFRSHLWTFKMFVQAIFTSIELQGKCVNCLVLLSGTFFVNCAVSFVCENELEQKQPYRADPNWWSFLGLFFLTRKMQKNFKPYRHLRWVPSNNQYTAVVVRGPISLSYEKSEIICLVDIHVHRIQL